LRHYTRFHFQEQGSVVIQDTCSRNLMTQHAWA